MLGEHETPDKPTSPMKPAVQLAVPVASLNRKEATVSPATSWHSSVELAKFDACGANELPKLLELEDVIHCVMGLRQV